MARRGEERKVSRVHYTCQGKKEERWKNESKKERRTTNSNIFSSVAWWRTETFKGKLYTKEGTKDRDGRTRIRDKEEKRRNTSNIVQEGDTKQEGKKSEGRKKVSVRRRKEENRSKESKIVCKYVIEMKIKN